MGHKEQILKGTIVFSIASCMTQVANVIRVFLIAKFLTPAELGILGFFLLMVEYGQFASLGAHNAFDVEYNLLAGAQRQKEADNLAEFTLAITLVFGLLVIVAGWIGTRFVGAESARLWIVTGVVVAFELLAIFLRFALRARRAYHAFSLTTFISSFCTLVLVFVVSKALTPRMVLVALGIGFLLSALYSYWNIRPRLSPALTNDYARSFARRFFILAISLFLYNGLTYGLQSLDRLFGAVLLKAEDFGYYVFAVSIVRAASILPNSFATILYPNILRKFAGAKDQMETYSTMQRVNAIMATATPLVVLTVMSMITFFINTFVPKYNYSTHLAYLAMSSVFFLTMPISCLDILIAKKKQKYLSFAILCMITGAVVLYGTFFLAGVGSSSILAAIYSIISFFYGVIFFVMAYREFDSLKAGIIGALGFLRFYLYMVVAFGIGRWVVALAVPFGGLMSFIGASACCAISLAAYFLLLIFLERSQLKTVSAELTTVLNRLLKQA